jgi:hypothetical protein
MDKGNEALRQSPESKLNFLAFISYFEAEN